MTIDLASAAAKLKRAEYHADQLSLAIDKYLSEPNFSFLFERDEENVDYRAVAKFKNQPDLIEWALMTGDCLTNVRAALDHMAYAIAVHQSGQNPPPREWEIQFTIEDNPQKFEAALPKQMRALPPLVKAWVRTYQPFGHNADVPHPFAVLRKLVNIDKHRRLRTAVLAPSEIRYNLVSPLQMNRQVLQRKAPVSDGDPILIVRCPQADPNLRIQVSSLLSFAIWHGQIAGWHGPDHSDLVVVLDSIIQHTRAFLRLLEFGWE